MASQTTNIFIDARGIRPGMTGIGRFTLEIARALARLGAEEGRARVRAAALPESIPALSRDAGLAGIEWVPFPYDYTSHPMGDLALRFRMPRLVRADEVYFAPAYIMPCGRTPFPRAAMIHDLGAFRRPGDYPKKFGMYLRWAIRRTVARAERLIVPTRHVADDLVSLFGACEGRVRVVPEAPATDEVEGWASPSDDARWEGRPTEKFFLSVGTFERRKDPLTAFNALAGMREAPPHRWLWIGGLGHESAGIMGAIRASAESARFHWAGYQERARIAEAMRGATALVYPSLDEGFGIPPLEAMAAGLPVVVSDHPALREVCGDAALRFPIGDRAALGEALARLATDAALRAEMIERGRKRAAEFTWRRAAEEAMKVFGEMNR